MSEEEDVNINISMPNADEDGTNSLAGLSKEAKAKIKAEREKSQQLQISLDKEIQDKEDWRKRHPILHQITVWKKTGIGIGISGLLATYLGFNPQHIPNFKDSDKTRDKTVSDEISYVYEDLDEIKSKMDSLAIDIKDLQNHRLEDRERYMEKFLQIKNDINAIRMEIRFISTPKRK